MMSATSSSLNLRLLEGASAIETNLLRSLRQSYDRAGFCWSRYLSFGRLREPGDSLDELAVACWSALSSVHEEIVLEPDAHVPACHNRERIHRELKASNSRSRPDRALRQLQHE